MSIFHLQLDHEAFPVVLSRLSWLRNLDFRCGGLLLVLKLRLLLLVLSFIIRNRGGAFVVFGVTYYVLCVDIRLALNPLLDLRDLPEQAQVASLAPTYPSAREAHPAIFSLRYPLLPRLVPKVAVDAAKAEGVAAGLVVHADRQLICLQLPSADVTLYGLPGVAKHSASGAAQTPTGRAALSLAQEAHPAFLSRNAVGLGRSFSADRPAPISPASPQCNSLL